MFVKRELRFHLVLISHLQDARKVAQDIAAGQRLPHNARSGAGLVVDFANSAIKVADGAGCEW